MKTVSLRELKNRLSEYVREVRDGETVLVTDRGEVVAELHKPLPPEAREDPYPGLLLLAQRGLLTRGAANASGLYPSLPPLLPPGSAVALLDEERGER
jgi:antitoxin (DNA-binding transcriptional repressor) of toxin-antitoxin stability system